MRVVVLREGDWQLAPTGLFISLLLDTTLYTTLILINYSGLYLHPIAARYGNSTRHNFYIFYLNTQMDESRLRSPRYQNREHLRVSAIHQLVSLGQVGRLRPVEFRVLNRRNIPPREHLVSRT